MKKLIILASIVAFSSGCASMSGSGVKVRGNEHFQTVTAQVDVLEVREVYKKEGGILATAKKPFVWIKENPKKSFAGLAVAGLSYWAYDEFIADSGGSSSKTPASTLPEGENGYVQNGKNNEIVIKGSEDLPDNLVQNGEGNTVTVSISNEEKIAKIEADVSITEIESRR